MEIKKNWMETLQDNFQALMRKYDMPEDIENELYAFVLTIAREQYKTGNKSGISWLRRQMAGANSHAPVAVSA